MALESVVVFGGIILQLGLKDMGCKPSGFALNWVNGSDKVFKWMRSGGFSSFSACRSMQFGRREHVQVGNEIATSS
jgi:hypothetical protein